jgi:hypothetical protein
VDEANSLRLVPQSRLADLAGSHGGSEPDDGSLSAIMVALLLGALPHKMRSARRPATTLALSSFVVGFHDRLHLGRNPTLPREAVGLPACLHAATR